MSELLETQIKSRILGVLKELQGTESKSGWILKLLREANTEAKSQKVHELITRIFKKAIDDDLVADDKEMFLALVRKKKTLDNKFVCTGLEVILDAIDLAWFYHQYLIIFF